MSRRSPFAVGLLAVGLLALTACDESSPTEPGPPALAGSIVFIDPNGQLEPYRDTITTILEQVRADAQAALGISGVRITVSLDRAILIPNWGLGGSAPNGFEIDIVIDPNYSGLEGILHTRLPQVVAHELHHAARWRGPGYGGTLLEVMISEGMADRFAIELTGAPIAPWSDAFPEDRTAFYLDRARPELDSSTFDFGAWFFGTGDLPHWTGYTLGYRLVEDYQRRTGRSAADLVNTSAEPFRPSSASE